MAKTLRASSLNNTNKKIRFFVSLIFFGFGWFAISQTNVDDAPEEIEKLLVVKPTTYFKIEETLKPYRRDTIFLNDFIEKATQNNYQEGLAYALNQKGTTLRNLAEFKKAVKLHQEALQISEVEQPRYLRQA